ncbi:unnamed protein product [Acanthoscelides obtectus]|uniref:Uncharacterized protein n=1 Tax=Acanthoscelides obtectus TaxID=200917 RepID=A0A9P0KID1_ACAOB|nr:unnamed protein product [Acanthoscelides obtectus]CAK1666665.1 hypothetical protein AOBTE_LOCUS25427 [Acanthoscelides obtectus]
MSDKDPVKHKKSANESVPDDCRLRFLCNAKSSLTSV